MHIKTHTDLHLFTVIISLISISVQTNRLMGNTIKKISPGGGTEENKTDDIGRIIDEFYPKLLATIMKPIDPNDEAKQLAEFYRAICEIVEEMNKRRSNTQFRVPTREVLNKAFTHNHKVQGKSLTKDEFGKILQQVVTETGFSGVGAKDSLIYIFGVPITALLLKQTVMPNAVSNDYFIPGITSATVLVLAKLNKI